MIPHRTLALLVSACALALVAGCSGSDVPIVGPKDPVTLSASVDDGAKDVPVDTLVEATAEHGTIDEVELASSDGKTTVAGEVGDDGRWVASERLEPGTTFRLQVTGTGDDDEQKTVTRTFTTRALSLDEQTYPSVAPLQGETVGVGMPVIVTFDLPVKDRALYERHMSVQAEPGVEGSWTWFSDREAHFRPESFWPAGTKVSVDLRLNSLPAGDGIYGQQDQEVDFTIGRKVVSTVDVRAHRLTVKIDDRVARTIPVSTGDSRHQTREGTKVVMEKFASVRMDAATTGVDSADPDYYDIDDVKWAMRVTNSGEFLHAAPWSAASHGRANVSHGCVGMSTANAKWVYDQSKRGDVVEFVNSPRPLEDRNGWTDWNVPWDEWQAGSALASTPS